jgi:hypothetical protein
VSFWTRELPFTLVLILTIGGVAYTSFSKQPIVGYWEILSRKLGDVGQDHDRRPLPGSHRAGNAAIAPQSSAVVTPVGG